MADLLARIRKMTLDPDTSLAVVLRHCLDLAYRLELDEFISWANGELNGYTDKKDLPPYRKTIATCYGTFMNAVAEYPDQPINLVSLPKNTREQVENVYLMEPVGAVEKIATDMNPGKPLLLEVPPVLIAMLNQQLKMRRGVHLVTAHRQASSLFPQSALEAVRNKVLPFVLELIHKGVRIDDDEEGADAPSQETKEKVQQVFNTTIHGNVQGIAAGVLGDANIAVNHGVTPGDVASLMKALTELGLEAEHRATLEEAIDADAAVEPEKAKESVGKQVAAWCGEFTEKVMSGAATAVTADKLPALLEMVKAVVVG